MAEQKIKPDSLIDHLDELRGQIDQLDYQLIELLARRQKIVEEVVACKQQRQLPVRHPAREADLIDDRRHRGREQGLNPDFIEDIFRAVVGYSRSTQTAEISRVGVRPGARVLIVGGAGAMGRVFGRWFKASGYEVRVLDVDDWDRAAELCADVDLALVSVPIAVTGKVIEALAPYLPPACILADLTSIKEPAVKAMLAAHPGPVQGFHPMFGPDTATMERQIVVISAGRPGGDDGWPAEQFSVWGAVLVRSAAAEHDEIMGVVQALRHFATFAFGRFLYDQQVDLKRTLEFSSPIYRLEIDMVGRLFAQDPDLYGEIIFASPRRLALLRAYLDNFQNNLELLEDGAAGREKFAAEFRKIAAWFGPFSDQAIRESGYLISRLIERF